MKEKKLQYKKVIGNEVTIRSSAAEYLTFIAATGDNPDSIEMRYENENVWLTQKMMAELYDVDVRTINEHLLNIFADNELIETATIRKFRIVQSEGTRMVEREISHYNLQAIISVGFKINNQRAVQFRKWANNIVKEYTIQGWTMDVERLKNFGTILTKDYFEKQLEVIREIRLSERRFYQKITDIYSTALDYDPSAKTTIDFFKKVQNKLHWAIHGHTAAELIYKRADAQKENMGLQTWEAAPVGKIRKSDALVAKNYLESDEMRALELIVSGYLDFAENQANRNIPMTMQDWAHHLDRILMATEHELLTNAGSISMEVARQHAETEWEKYRIVQDRLFESDFDRFLQLNTAVKAIDKKGNKK
ncbi:MAG: virulence RhuM family protein [Paludibacteraceae bacterium]